MGVNLATPFPKVYLVPLLPLGKVEPKHNKMRALFVGGDMVFGVNLATPFPKVYLATPFPKVYLATPFPKVYLATPFSKGVKRCK